MNRPDLDEARRLARELGGARVPRHVPVALERALGRVLAVDVRAASHVPAADSSAVDGWAVSGPGPWQLVGAVQNRRAEDGAAPDRRADVGALSSRRGDSGAVPHRRAGDGAGSDCRVDAGLGVGRSGAVERLGPGQACAVATGDALPRGADAALRREDGLVDQGRLHAPDPAAGRHVRTRGEELRAGEMVLGRGAVLTPARLGLVAAAGADTVHVVVEPRGVLLVLGDELSDSGTARPGRTRDSLSHVLPPVLHDLGVDLGRTARTGDDPQTLRDVFAGPYRSTVDLVVTTGGTGRGPADHVREALRDVGARTVVDGTVVRPGASAVLAVVPDGPVVLGLPGDPLASVAAVTTLLVPLLHGWLGRPDEPLPEVVRPEGADVPDVGTRLLPARLVPGRGRPVPTGHDGAPMLRGLADAQGFVVLGVDGRCRWLTLP
ncbi:molybdopterin molybdotransferase MoeA [Aquipuribacter sp. MA13-6]|uniref:molybdopterin molybdotransferase MoeA n=1 Tax=unclassified Aquipuribacter TaxID=2635084 RepID=UPI003EED1988